MIQQLQVTGKKKNNIETQISYNHKGSSFDHKAASLYSVAIHANNEQITLGISNPKTGEVIEVNQYEAQGKNAKEKLESLVTNKDISNIFKSSTKTIFYSTNSNFTLIPSVFFNDKIVTDLVKPVIEIQDGEEILTTFIPEIDGYIAFAQKKEITNLLKSNIGHVHIRHHFGSLISTYHLYYAKESGLKAFIQYHNKTFTLCLMNGKKMVSFNVFDLTSFEDVVYYTYYSMEQFDFSPADTEIHIGGDYSNNQEVLTTLQRYTSKIFHLKPLCCKDLDSDKADALINTIFDIQCG